MTDPSSRARLSARTLAWGLGTVGAACGAIGLIDPGLRLAGAGALLALAGAVVALRARPRVPVALLLAAIAVLCWVETHRDPNFGADSPSYYVFLRSAAFDHDIDSTNEWEHWGYGPRGRTVTGLPRSPHAVGPAVLWAPFFAVAHGQVLLSRALGHDAGAPDGYSAPYLRATGVGTIVIALLGAFLLLRALAGREGVGTAALAVIAIFLATPVVYYVLVQPTMSHGVEFGVAAVLAALLLAPARRWPLIGLTLGLLTLVRWQSLVWVLLVVPLALADLRARAVSVPRMAVAAGLAVLAFVPQMIAWWLMFGSPVTMPQGEGFVDWSAPHLLDTLVTADRGVLVWMPVAVLGFLGLVLDVRRDRLFAWGALAVVVATAWVNGSVSHWTGDRAFGPRRYTLVLPLIAVGLAVFARALAGLAVRRPLLVPATVLGLAVLWNLGMVRLYIHEGVVRAAPIAEVAAGQAEHVEAVGTALLTRASRRHGPSLAYEIFDGEYLFENAYLQGIIPLASASERHLSGAWSKPDSREDWPRFRWALAPSACVMLPLLEARELPLALSMRAARRQTSVAAEATINGVRLGPVPMEEEWKDVPVTVPARYLVKGPNVLCLEFTGAAPGDRMAAVSAVVLP